MRSMELVGRERMEVAVSMVKPLSTLSHADLPHSNNSPYGVKLATTMSPT